MMKSVTSFFKNLWTGFRALARWAQILIVIILLAVVVGIFVLVRGKSSEAEANILPTVTVKSVNSFAAGSDSVDVLGTVQSVSEADLLAQSAGTVESVNTTLGASVPQGS